MDRAGALGDDLSAVSTQAAVTCPGRGDGHVALHGARAGARAAERPRTDIFAFGCVLYEMLSGRRAFEGDTAADTMSAILTKDPRPLADLGVTVPDPTARNRPTMPRQAAGRPLQFSPRPRARARGHVTDRRTVSFTSSPFSAASTCDDGRCRHRARRPRGDLVLWAPWRAPAGPPCQRQRRAGPRVLESSETGAPSGGRVVREPDRGSDARPCGATGGGLGYRRTHQHWHGRRRPAAVLRPRERCRRPRSACRVHRPAEGGRGHRRLRRRVGHVRTRGRAVRLSGSFKRPAQWPGPQGVRARSAGHARGHPMSSRP